MLGLMLALAANPASAAPETSPPHSEAELHLGCKYETPVAHATGAGIASAHARRARVFE